MKLTQNDLEWSNRHQIKERIRDAAGLLRDTADKLDRIANYDACSAAEVAAAAVEEVLKVLPALRLGNVVRLVK